MRGFKIDARADEKQMTFFWALSVCPSLDNMHLVMR